MRRLSGVRYSDAAERLSDRYSDVWTSLECRISVMLGITCQMKKVEKSAGGGVVLE
jgi:hypothetical protein